MLRRGIPFGPFYDHDDPMSPRNSLERGLLFVSYQRSIKSQFQNLNNDWMNHDTTPMPFGFDLLVGQNTDPASGLYAPKPADFNSASNPDPVRFAATRQWVVPTGGAFLFAPSISTLRTFSPQM
jgi:deferrochelatase/peroxidase EfeB